MLNSYDQARRWDSFQPTHRGVKRFGIGVRAALTVMAVWWVSLMAAPALAQNDSAAPDLFPDFSLGGFGDESSDPDQWSARYTVTEPGSGHLQVEVSLADRWHVYSVTQEPGGPTRTRISISTPGVRATAAFKPNEPPHSSVSTVFKNVTVEEHEGVVTWSAPITLPDGFNTPIQVSIDALVCKTDGSCIPVQQELTAARAQSAAAAPAKVDEKKDSQPAVKPFRDGKYVVQWVGLVAPGSLKPGDRGVLRFTAKPDVTPDTYHVYRAAIDDTESSTNFVVASKGGFKVGAPQTDNPVISKTLLASLPPIHYHKGDVTWDLPFEVPTDLAPGEHTIEGMIGYQACTDNSCQRPMALKFTAKINVAAAPADASASPITLTTAKYAAALDAAATVKWVDKIAPADAASDVDGSVSGAAIDTGAVPPSAGSASADASSADIAASESDVVAPEASKSSLGGLLIFAFIGGVILNFMPCVLPVVGLKVMSFVKQAGEDRGRVLKLNVVYVAGILSVFALLAVFAVFLNFSWGQQFTFFEVKLGLTLLLFALALSYLGVWEIPAPSFAASKKSQELEGREGYAGAFAKGAFATVLATPCSGPLLGYIFGTTFGLSPWQTILVIMTVGLGMSVPYLIIGARPELVSWLPKPGAWMETLKEFLAFLFLGTVAFFFHGFSDEHKLPVFVALIGVWFGCWIIGKVPNWETLRKRLAAWTAGVASAAVISIAAFQFLVPGEATLKWEDYDEARLAELQRQGRTVMIDFTADWCVNCLVNYEVAIDTEATREMLEELNAVPMIADWSDRSNTIIPAKLKELRSRSIPVLAIYPGSRPDKPIVLRDLVSQSTVLEALREAGPSMDSSAALVGSQESANIAATTH